MTLRERLIRATDHSFDSVLALIQAECDVATEVEAKRWATTLRDVRAAAFAECRERACAECEKIEAMYGSIYATILQDTIRALEPQP